MTNRALTTIVAGLAVILLSVFLQSYEGRQDLVTQARAGCERAKLDRTQQANVYEKQADADRILARDLERSETVLRARQDREGAEREAADDLRSRTGDNLKCAEVYPSASPLPF